MTKVDAAKFVLQCRNWTEVAIPIAAHKMPLRVILRNGIRFESQALYWPDMYAIFFQNTYTPQYVPIECSDVVVDIGANIGVFTTYAASMTQNVVYAIEPSQRNFQALTQNVRLNKLKNVVTLNYAVSDKSGVELFLDEGVSQQRRLKRVVKETITEKYVEVPCITLEDLMVKYQLERIDFLKLDCEGAEEAILRSTSHVYLRKVRKIALEFHDHLTQCNHRDLCNRLEKAGFTTQVSWDGKSVLGFIYAWRR